MCDNKRHYTCAQSSEWLQLTCVIGSLNHKVKQRIKEIDFPFTLLDRRCLMGLKDLAQEWFPSHKKKKKNNKMLLERTKSLRKLNQSFRTCKKMDWLCDHDLRSCRRERIFPNVEFIKWNFRCVAHIKDILDLSTIDSSSTYVWRSWGRICCMIYTFHVSCYIRLSALRDNFMLRKINRERIVFYTFRCS